MRYVASGTPDDFLEFLSLPRAVFGELLVVLDALLGLGEGLFLKVGRFSEELFRCNLRISPLLTFPLRNFATTADAATHLQRGGRAVLHLALAFAGGAHRGGAWLRATWEEGESALSLSSASLLAAQLKWSVQPSVDRTASLTQRHARVRQRDEDWCEISSDWSRIHRAGSPALPAPTISWSGTPSSSAPVLPFSPLRSQPDPLTRSIPADTPFEDGTFRLVLTFEETYPNNPPTVKFLSKMVHPNVYANGDLCLDILQNRWSPTYDVAAILTSIQSLLHDPNPNSFVTRPYSRGTTADP